MIKRLFAKFDGVGLECACDFNVGKCSKYSKKNCKEYVVKFVEVERGRDIDGIKKDIDNTVEKINKVNKEQYKLLQKILNSSKKIKSKLHRDINKFKV